MDSFCSISNPNALNCHSSMSRLRAELGLNRQLGEERSRDRDYNRNGKNSWKNPETLHTTPAVPNRKSEAEQIDRMMAVYHKRMLEYHRECVANNRPKAKKHKTTTAKKKDYIPVLPGSKEKYAVQQTTK
jgi:hypothetical protein